MARQTDFERFRALLFILLGGVLLWMLSHKGNLLWGDDQMYSQALQSKTFVEWLTERRAIWSGRTFIDGVTLLLINHEWLWRFLMVGVWLGMLAIMAHLSENDQHPIGVLFVLLSPFVMPREVVAEASWWMTGSFNYLWPVAAAWLVLLVFLRADLVARLFWLCLVAALYAGSHEQVGLVLVALQLLTSIRLVRHRQWRWQHGALVVFALASLVSTVAATGSLRRYYVVTYYWFPEYLEWRLGERILAGMDMAFSHFFNHRNHLSLVFLVLLAVLVFQRVRSPLQRVIGLIPLALYGLGMWWKPRASVHGVRAWLAEMWSFQRKPAGYDVYGLTDFAMSVNPAFYVHFFLVSMGTLCVAVSLWNTSLQSRYVGGRTAAPLAFCAALCSVMVMGLSPTLYASGERVYFVQDIGILFLSGLVFAQLQGDAFKRSLNVLLLLAVAYMLWRFGKGG